MINLYLRLSSSQKIKVFEVVVVVVVVMVCRITSIRNRKA